MKISKDGDKFFTEKRFEGDIINIIKKEFGVHVVNSLEGPGNYVSTSNEVQDYPMFENLYILFDKQKLASWWDRFFNL